MHLCTLFLNVHVILLHVHVNCHRVYLDVHLLYNVIFAHCQIAMSPEQSLLSVHMRSEVWFLQPSAISPRDP